MMIPRIQPRRVHCIVIAALLLSLSSVASPAAAETPSWMQAKLDFDDIDFDRLARAVFLVTNETRQKHGKAPVAHHRLLEKAAQGHAERMVEGDFFSHRDPHSAARSTPLKRLAQLGVKNPQPAENIATELGIDYREGEAVYVIDASQGLFSRKLGGQPIPPHTYRSFAKAVVSDWMDSSGHRANLLSNDAVQLGCGSAFFREKGFPKLTVVQVFQLHERIETDTKTP